MEGKIAYLYELSGLDCSIILSALLTFQQIQKSEDLYCIDEIKNTTEKIKRKLITMR